MRANPADDSDPVMIEDSVVDPKLVVDKNCELVEESVDDALHTGHWVHVEPIEKIAHVDFLDAAEDDSNAQVHQGMEDMVNFGNGGGEELRSEDEEADEEWGGDPKDEEKAGENEEEAGEDEEVAGEDEEEAGENEEEDGEDE